MSSVSNDGEPPRKRVRKGTKSCWECKRRKIKCQLSSEDVPVCSGCLARGTTCLSQEYPEERESTSGGSQMGERLGRMERLLETLLAKVSAYEEEEETQKAMLTPQSIGNDVLTPFSANPSSNAANDSPFLSLFDNSLIGRRDIGGSQMPTPASQSGGSKTSSCRTSKIDRIRQALVELLPSQKDTDLINDNSSSWLLIHALVNRPSKFGTIGSPFNIIEVRQQHPTSIARTLLHLAVCLQQLDPTFDAMQLHLYPSPEARMERYITTVQALITSDDELVSTMEGLECLTLLGLHQINAGNPRRAWLTFRRALNICQLMGLHKKEASNIPGGREMWYQIIQADRYLALLLGLPCGSEDGGFGPEETFKNPNSDADALFVRHLGDISGRLIERNQTDYSHAYAATQDIDEQLENLSKEMPASWWQIPEVLVDDRSRNAARQFDRMMTQIWFFQLEALLHLPFMLKAATERRYDYSKFSCLKASREMTHRYLALRSQAANRSFCCKIVDFGALTASVTLFLGLIGSSTIGETNEQKLQRETDRKTIQEVLESMEELSKGGKDVVATQSVNVIRSLLAVDSPSSQSNGNLKLAIPYFGTISIVRPQQTPKLNPATSLPYPPNPPCQIDQQLPTQNWQGISAYTTPSMASNSMNYPMVQFTSSQYPNMAPENPPIENWGLTEADTLFFDSLLNTDIEGNWIF